MWASALLGGFVASFAALMLSAASGQTGGERFSDNWWLAGPAFVALGCAAGALVAGVFAIVRRRERSLPVIVAVLIGLLASWFVVGEIVSPH